MGPFVFRISVLAFKLSTYLLGLSGKLLIGVELDLHTHIHTYINTYIEGKSVPNLDLQ